MNKQWTITVIVLLMLLNIASIGFMWWKNVPHRFDRRQEEKASEYIINELNLDAKQQVAYMALLKAHREQMKEADRDLMKTKDAFFDLLQDDNVDSSKAIIAAAFIGKAEERNNLIILQHFQQLKTICNDEQKKKLITVLKGILGRMKNHPPPHNNEEPEASAPPPQGAEGNHPPQGSFENEPPPPPPPR